MIIRRNSKEFKAIRNLFIESSKSSKKKPKLYVIQAGESLDKRLDISELGKAERDFHYELNLEAVLMNLDDKNLTLHKSDNEDDLYYFRDASRDRDLNPFSLKEKLEGKMDELANKHPGSVLKARKSQSRGRDAGGTQVEAEEEKPLKKSTAIKLQLPGMYAKEMVEAKSESRQEYETDKKIEKAEKKSRKQKEKRYPVKERGKEKAVKTSKENRKQEPKPSPAPAADEETDAYGLKKPLHFTRTNQLLYPDLGLRKQDVLAYYNEIGEHILPYLKDRPVVFKWHPKDIESSVFNQSLRGLKSEWKGDLPEWVESIEVYARKYDEKVPYMLCQDKEHLLLLAEIGCIEVNPWHSRIQHIEKPDYVLIDLDPTETEFEDVIEIAQGARKILEGLELNAFLKTSGNTGLHIYIPLDAKEEYALTRDLPKIICKLIHLKYPEKSSLERLPAKRKGKVYLDYLQNDMVKTITAPYSLRANSFAGVATPLEWDELNRRLNPEDFSIKNFIRRIDKKGDILKGILKKGVNAKKTIESLRKNYGFLLE